MKFSCFDDKSGMYTYFESPEQRAINADLPIPRFGKTAGSVGVAAIEAGRPLPVNAKRVGQGWAAQGILVRCDGGGLSGTMDDAATWLKGDGWKWIAGGLVALFVVKKVL